LLFSQFLKWFQELAASQEDAYFSMGWEIASLGHQRSTFQKEPKTSFPLKPYGGEYPKMSPLDYHK
jgi:hypothetical protein